MKPKKILLAILCLSLNCALANSIPQPQSTNQVAKNETNDDLSLILGWGYDSALKQRAGATPLKNLDSFKIKTQDKQTEIYFSDRIDLEKIAVDLNLDLSAAGGWKDFSGGTAAEYLLHVANTEYTENFTYSEKYRFPATLDIATMPPGMKAFTPTAKFLCNNDPTCKDGIEDFTKIYGDSLITDIPLGGLLLVNFQIKFNSAYLKQQFDYAIQGKMIGFFDATESLKLAIAQSKAQGSLEFSAYQLGGDPRELAGIFQKAPGGNYYITTCSLDKLDDCKGIINGVIGYAQGSFAKQFEQSTPENLAVVGKLINALPYTTLFHIAQPATPGQEIDQAQSELMNLYHDQLTKQAFVNHILQIKPIVTQLLPTIKDTLLATKVALDNNVNLIQAHAMECYTPGKWKTCPATVANINSTTANNRSDYNSIFKKILSG